MSTRVCAVVVTYHPDKDFARHVAGLRSQVDGLVVVDNRSSDSERVWLRQLAQRYSFALLENPSNLGTGAALNRGIRWAAGRGGFEWVVLLDQDSEATEGFVAALVTRLQRHPAPDRVAVVAPRIYNRNIGSTDGPRGTGDQYLVVQTSGSLMPISVFSSVGWFREDLFIDGPDCEYCLRAVSAGWSILYCDDAVLSHVPGNACRREFCGRYLVTTMNYSPVRHYYSTRNRVWIMRQYGRRYPRFCARMGFDILREKTRVLLFEEGWRAKLKLSLVGCRDALQGKLGKRQQDAGEERR